MNYEDFYEYLWDYVSHKIIDDHYFFERESMFREITKDIYDIYLQEEAQIDPKYYSRVVESIFFSLFKWEKKNTVKEDTDYNSY